MKVLSVACNSGVNFTAERSSEHSVPAIVLKNKTSLNEARFYFYSSLLHA